MLSGAKTGREADGLDAREGFAVFDLPKSLRLVDMGPLMSLRGLLAPCSLPALVLLRTGSLARRGPSAGASGRVFGGGARPAVAGILTEPSGATTRSLELAAAMTVALPR